MNYISVECWKCKKSFIPDIKVLDQKTTVIELKTSRLVTEIVKCPNCGAENKIEVTI